MRPLFPGTRLLVFNHRVYIDDVETPLSMTMQPATVTRWYGYKSKRYGLYPNQIDVVFDSDPRESCGHFAPETEVEMNRVLLNEVYG